MSSLKIVSTNSVYETWLNLLICYSKIYLTLLTFKVHKFNKSVARIKIKHEKNYTILKFFILFDKINYIYKI